MPNHVKTVCKVTGPPADVERFEATHIVDKEKCEVFDFNTIIPMPKSVENTESGTEADAGFYALTGLVGFHFIFNDPQRHYRERGYDGHSHEAFAAFLEERFPDVLAKGIAQLAAFRETGHRNWFDWACANWGTKWNSYGYKKRSYSDGEFIFEFQTAWSVPEPIFAKLSSMYPELTFELASVDEGDPQYEGKFTGGSGSVERVENTPERYDHVYGEGAWRKYQEEISEEG